MATITYSLADLKGYGIGKSQLQKAVDSLGMEVEELGQGSATIDITPNRPDLLDIVGFARAVNSLLGRQAPKEGRYAIENGPIFQLKVSGAVRGVRPYIAALVAKNLNLSGSRLKYLINFTEKLSDTYGRKRRKLAMGLHSLDAIKDPLVYDAARDKRFIPLGSGREMSFDQIMRAHSKGLEYGSTVGAGSQGALYPYLADTEGVMSLIPIINSERTRVGSATRDLLVDVTGTSKKAVSDVVNMVACSFIDAGAEVYPCTVVYGSRGETTPLLRYREIRLKKIAVEKTLGAAMERHNIISLANKMGYPAVKYGDYVLAYVPPYRVDVLNEQDVIEDIAIAYGYNRITPIPVSGFSVGVPADTRQFVEKVSAVMLGLGFTECMNTYLTNERLNFASMQRRYDKESTVGVAYAKTEAITMLRTSVLPELLQSLGQSAKERMPQRMFELGGVFSVENGRVMEGAAMALVSAGSKAGFAEARSVVDAIMVHLVGKDYKVKPADDPAYIKGRCASIELDGRQIGVFGEIAPQVLMNFKIEEPVVAAEIRIDALRSGAQ